MNPTPLWQTYVSGTLQLMRLRPLRSALSLAGIYVGILALLIIVAIQEGERRQIDELYRLDRARLFFVLPTFDPATRQSGVLRPDDLERLADIRGVQSLLPRAQAQRDVRVNGQTIAAELAGIDPDYLRIYRIPLREGRHFMVQELQRRERVCLLTPRGLQRFFSIQSPRRDTIEIGGELFDVLGVVDWNPGVAQRTAMGIAPDVLVPFPLITRRQQAASIPMVEVRIDPEVPAQEARARIERGLAHGDPRRAKLYTIQNAEEMWYESRSATLHALRSLLAVAAIGLLIGALGVANVMVISVLERTREIGIRKAIGATRRDILIQFLIESAVLTGLGAALAALSAIVAVLAAPWVMPSTYTLALGPGAVSLCLAVSLATGLLAGAYPAARAAGLVSTEALRYE